MLGLATTNLCTKFLISTLIHYKDMKLRRRKMQKFGWFGERVWVTQGHQQHSHSIEHIHATSYSTLIETICIYKLYRYRVIALFTLKVANFNPSQLHLSPTYVGVIPVELRHDLWHQKTRFLRLSCGIICMILGLAVMIQWAECDRQTDRHTDTPYTTMAYIALAWRRA